MPDEPIVATPQPAPSLEDRVANLQGPARMHYRMTGRLDEAEAKMAPAETNSDVPAASSPAPSEPPSEPESGETETDSEPVPRGTQPTPKDNPKFAPQLRAELSKQRTRAERAEAERDLLQRQLAETRNSAPGTPAVKETLAPAPGQAPKKPEFPDIDAFDDVKSWNAAVRQYESDFEAYQDWKMEQRFARETQSRQTEAVNQTLTERIAAGRAKYKDDFDAVAFNEAVPASDVSIAVIQDRADFADLAYHLGKNVKVAERIASLTSIPKPGGGSWRNYAEMLAAAKQDADLAIRIGEARALARVEFDRIAESFKTAPKPKNSLPKPTSEVSLPQNRANVIGDDEAAAVANNNQEAFNRIRNRKDLERAGIRI